MGQFDQILTVFEVQDAALSSSTAVEDDPAQVQEAILDVQDRISTYIDQPVMIHKRTQGIATHDWLEDEVEDTTQYRVWADARPVVEVDNPTEVTIRFDEQQLVREKSENTKAVYFAGWKRRDQALSDLPTSSGEDLDGLTTEPPTLPRDIRRIAIRLVLFTLNEAEHSAGMGSTSTTVQGGSITVDGPDQSFVRTQMRKLDAYKRSPF